MLSPHSGQDNATSPVTGVILMVAIVLILAALVLCLVPGFNFGWLENDVPAIFKITKISHDTNFDSSMVVKNTGAIGYKNKNLYAKTYKNGNPLPCVISTMNGKAFISTHHFGVQYIAGMSGQTWYPNAAIRIDYKDKTFQPEDVVMFEVYDNTTNQIISRDTYPRTNNHDVSWFYSVFLNHRVA
jgi:flagellin-like protein